MVLTCMFPIRSANKTNPRVATMIAKTISPTEVLVERSCPRALHKAMQNDLDQEKSVHIKANNNKFR